MTNCHILLNVAVALIVVIVGFGRGEELEPIPNLVEEEESHVVEKLPLPPPEHEDGRCRCVCPRLSALLGWVHVAAFFFCLQSTPCNIVI